ncbi:MAG: TlpA family protein disulfide reductase, partial [Oscillospiraceae bacterium]|nr:TlpA family protein disulfide reductase [Oscillospiraceae bacterium]
GEQVEFILVNLTDNNQETVKSAKDFLSTTEYTFPVYFDTQLSGAMAYGVVGIPATYFIDAEGYVVAGANSALDYATLEYGISLILED